MLGTVLFSETPGVTYRLDSVIGEGAHGVVYLAERRQAEATAEVVVKLLRPRAVRQASGLVASTIMKEVAALKRLGARVPPVQNVIQFLDAGTVRVGEPALELPWVAVEYVRGGDEGVTLGLRVVASIARSGAAFPARRAQRAVEGIAAGIAAVHELNVIHRDVAPSNVLVTGTGTHETFKLADFGLARVGSVSTFGDVLLGTPGYCAPEQSFPGSVGIGPYTDVFGLACTTYFVLTGEPYFQAPTIAETLVAVYDPTRRSLLDARALSAELRARPEACRAIDGVIAAATRAKPEERLQSVGIFGGQVLPLLAQDR